MLDPQWLYMAAHELEAISDELMKDAGIEYHDVRYLRRLASAMRQGASDIRDKEIAALGEKDPS